MAGSQNSPSYIQILRKIEVCAVYIKINIILILYLVLQVFTIHIIVKQKLRSGYKHRNSHKNSFSDLWLR